MNNYIEINKKLWDEKTKIHSDSDFYDVKSFLEGKDTLNQIELDLLGDVTGKKILHLQCHFGLDTISLARRGAHVTGVDFSSKAIEKAKELNTIVGTNVNFVLSNVYDLPNILNEKFDVIFTSYGVVGWLANMKEWAKVIHHFLNQNGVFVMAEFHPVVWMFSYDFNKIEFNYMDEKPIIEELEGTYANPKANIKEKSISWNHGLGKIIDAIAKTGLKITDFKEFNYSPYNCFKNTVLIEEKKYQIKGLENKIPLVYAVKAVK